MGDGLGPGTDGVSRHTIPSSILAQLEATNGNVREEGLRRLLLVPPTALALHAPRVIDRLDREAKVWQKDQRMTASLKGMSLSDYQSWVANTKSPVRGSARHPFPTRPSMRASHA